MKKILLATQKPFSVETVDSIRKTLQTAGLNLEILEGYKDRSDLVHAVQTATGLIIRSDIVDEEVITNAKDLKIIVRAGAGYDNVDLDLCTDKKIVVMNTPGQNSNAVAELVIGFMIYGARNFFNSGTGQELRGKKLGLQAYGNVGSLVAAHAKGLGVNVMAFDPYVAKEKIANDGVEVAKDLNDLYESCDIVSIHIPATESTINSINYDLISKMPKNSVLINTARKEVINEPDLLRVLSERFDITYITDVSPDNYTELQVKAPEQVFATPKKIGAETAQANYAAGLAAANQIVEFTNNGTTKFQVN